MSHACDLDTVPTILLADATGRELQRFVGFGKHDWQELNTQLAQLTQQPPPVIDWTEYPESRPGCGSKSVEPGISERLAAEVPVEGL